MSGSLGNKSVMASNIKRHLKELNLTVKDFSEILGFKYSTVLDWTNGRTYPRIDKIEMMANYFGVDKSDLVEEYNGAVIEKDKGKEKLISNYDELNEGNKKELVNISSDMLEEQKQAEIIKIDKKFLEVARQAVAFDGKEFSDKEIEAIAQVLKENFNNDDL